MSETLRVDAGQASPSLVIDSAAGSTQAVDIDAITPDTDGFICGRQRALCRSKPGGIAIVITDAAVPQTGMDLRGTLTVVTYPDLTPLSEPMTVCDFSISPNVHPKAGHCLRLGRPPLATLAEPGQRIALVWNEIGGLGDDGEISPTYGTRPAFALLGWPLVAVEPVSF